MMLKEDYRRLFDSISPNAALEQRTRKEIMEMLNRKNAYRSLRSAVCIAAAALLLVGTAFAAVSASGILTRLFPNGEPSQQAAESVVRDAAQDTQNGLTLNIDEYLFDQNSLHIGWTVSSEREKDVFYTTGYELTYGDPADETVAGESVGGTLGGYSSGEVGDGVLMRLSGDAPEYSGYAGYLYNAALKAPVTVRVFVHAYETDLEQVSVESCYDVCDMAATLEEAGRIGVDGDGQTRINGYAAFEDALKELTQAGMDWDEANEAALAQSGVFNEVAVLEATVTVDPAQAAQARFTLDGERTFELSDATVILRTLNVDTAATIVEYDVIGKTLGESTAANGVSYILFDQNGNPLNVDYSLGMAGNQQPDQDGKPVWRITHDGNPLPESVTAITFVPTAPLERLEGESSNAFFLRMAQEASEDQCFTIELTKE